MLIRFKEISPLGSCYEIQEIDKAVSMQECVVQPLLDARCILARKGDNDVELQGYLKTSLTLVCDRCLSSYGREIESDWRLLFKVAPEDSWYLGDLESAETEVETIYLDEPVIDIDAVILQQLYLILPMKKLCVESCHGICPWCGANRNQIACRCAGKGKNSPFAVLAQLKK